MADHIECMKRSIDLARQSSPEDGKARPRVGALAVSNGQILATAFRGELAAGEHAEFTLLEKKMQNGRAVDCTIYTTLEPCTCRDDPKISCAKRLIENRVKKVVIGMLDPNPIITGRGVLALNSAGIETELFPLEYSDQVVALNREFIRSHSEPGKSSMVTPAFIEANEGRSLDEWYVTVNRIYWNLQFHCNYMDVYAHLVEVALALGVLTSYRPKPKVDPQQFLVKAFGWWMTLCGKLSIDSVSDLVWRKYPGICPYCGEQKHEAVVCAEIKSKDVALDWIGLVKAGKKKKAPKSLGQWQQMFATIYPPVMEYGVIFGRLAEELGEMAEALRVFPLQPGYFLSEAADVFQWLMHVQNALEQKAAVPPAKRGVALERAFVRAYPDFCTYCTANPCTCPPIVQSTIGRIAREIPVGSGPFGELKIFMTPEIKRHRFASHKQPQ